MDIIEESEKEQNGENEILTKDILSIFEEISYMLDDDEPNQASRRQSKKKSKDININYVSNRDRIKAARKKA